MPFKFDIWEAGMDEVDILRIAKNNNINLMDETDSYRYSTKLLDEYASVKLYLTAKTRKLMEVSISWNNGRKVKGAVLEMLNQQNAKRSGFAYKTSERTEITIESVVGVDLTMKYKDIWLIKSNVEERKTRENEEKENLIARESNRFFGKEKSKSQEIYKITDENGTVHYTNVPETVKSGNISNIKMKPLNQIQIKEVEGYIVHLKNGKRIKSKSVQSDGSTVRFKEGAIATETPINEISAVEELSTAGSQMLDLRSKF